jgi:hypothetical protein
MLKKLQMRPHLVPGGYPRGGGDMSPDNLEPVGVGDQLPPKPHGNNPRTKSRQLMMVNGLRKKEEKWDSRFYLQHIPNYDPLDDRHCESNVLRVKMR